MTHSLLNFGGKYIYLTNDEDPEYNEICSKHIDATVRRFFIKMLTILASFWLAMIGPIHAYISQGIKTTTTNVRIPFTDVNSDAEFIGNIILQSVIGFHGVFGYIMIEVAMSMFDDVITITPKLIKFKLKRLDEAVKMRQNDLQICLLVKDIIKQSMDYDK